MAILSDIIIDLKDGHVFLSICFEGITDKIDIADYKKNPEKLNNSRIYEDIVAFLESNGHRYSPKELRAKINLKIMEYRQHYKDYQQKIKDAEEKTRQESEIEKQEQEEQIPYITKPISITELEEIYRKWFYIEDMDCLHVTLATALSEQMPGSPVWLMLVAVPSSIKTELIRALGDHVNEFIRPIGDLTQSALITGHEDGQDLAPKLHKKVGTISDVTGLLSTDEKTRNKVFGDLRMLYDGYMHKQFGGLISQKEHHVHTTIIGGVTTDIEKYKMFLASLGDRFINCRIRYSTDKASKKAMEVVGEIEGTMRKEVKLYTLSFLKQQKIIHVTISDDYKLQIQEVAQFIARCRTGISRDREGILLVNPEPEQPPRLVKQLSKLAQCIAIIRGRNEVNYDDIVTIRKIGFDTCPEMRVRMLGALWLSKFNLINTENKVNEYLKNSDIDNLKTELNIKKEMPLENLKARYRKRELSKVSPKTQNIAKICGSLDNKTSKAILEDMILLRIVEKKFEMEGMSDIESEIVEEPEEKEDKEQQQHSANYWYLNEAFIEKYYNMLSIAFEQNRNSVRLDKEV